MTDYVNAALFVYTEDSQHLVEQLQNNAYSTEISPISVESLLQDPQAQLENIKHIVVAGSLASIKSVLSLAMQYEFSVGLIPLESQKTLIKSLDLPKAADEAIELALRCDAQPMDLILCNGKILLFKASIGRVPLLDSSGNRALIDLLRDALKKFIGIKLLRFVFSTAREKTINTIASGCMIIQIHKGSLASRMIQSDSSVRDGAISLIITSPFSIVEYLRFLFQSRSRSSSQKALPNGIGFIKSNQIDIDAEIELDVFIDGTSETHTPVHCETIPDAVRLNAGVLLEEQNKSASTAKESIRIDNIPNGKELEKAGKNKIPFFSYASEERFRELFVSLRSDARLNTTYVVLLILSALLATFGLYLNSAAVIIGAMVLAPLMNPIVSISMGLLRSDRTLFNESAKTIVSGIVLALLASALVALLFPHKPVTGEMLGRLNPTLLDLAVAIISGIAAAYSKSFKEVAQSLAGVAIAVALVPPLAVAGIGLGNADWYFFLQAFLLFSTNLVGIILAATFTFRVLGYSPVVRNKRGISFVILSLILITIPLSLSYTQIVDTLVFEKNMEKERFLVNEKYLIIKNVRITNRRNAKVINMDIYTRDNLTRHDLDTLKQKIQARFTSKLFIRTEIIYIL